MSLLVIILACEQAKLCPRVAKQTELREFESAILLRYGNNNHNN
jgi:hypothetical protein